MPRPPSSAKFIQQLTDHLGDVAASHGRRAVARHSSTLANTIKKVRVSRNEVSVRLTHYWALYLHDGRGSFSKPTAMIWFRDPKDDPRLRAFGGQTPPRASQLRSMRMHEAEYRYWLGQNRLADPDGKNPQRRPMIVTKTVRRGTSPTRFFENDGGMRFFPAEASRIIQREFSDHVKRTLGPLLDVRDTASVRLG